MVGGIGSLEQLQGLADEILGRAMASKRFIFIDKDLKIDKPRIDVQIDRDKAAMLGIDMQTLASRHGGDAVGRLHQPLRAAEPLVPRDPAGAAQRPPQRQRSSSNYYTRTRDGELIPLSTIVTLKESAQPQQLKRFQQLNAVDHLRPAAPGREQG